LKILLITGYFPPEMAAAPNLNYELGRELVRLGHSVTVATGFPRYNLKEMPAKYRGKLYMREMMDGMTVERIWYPGLPRKIPVARGIDIILMAFALVLSALRADKADVASVFSPPLTVGLTAILMRRLRGYPFVYNVHDLFPQNAVDLGVLRSKALIRIFRRMESYIYRRSDHLTVISSGNRDRVIASGADPDRTVIVPDWVDSDFVFPGNKRNGFSERHGIADKFVVSFTGVMGFSQDLDTVLAAARLLADKPDIRFLLVGDGVEKPRLQAEAEKQNLKKVIFLPMMPREDVPIVLSSSDVCLATLPASVKTPPVPSKIVWAMSAGRPLITCLPLDGDAPDLIHAADCGICLPPEDPRALADAVARLRANPDECRRLGENGRKYVLENLSLKRSAQKYLELFEAAVASRARPGLRETVRT
jgi:glycosyltransferase involved in cell wall biosynthesis